MNDLNCGSMGLFSGMAIVAVDAGTEIEFEGETLTVTESAAVALPTKLYVTHSMAAALRDHPSVKPMTVA